MTERFSFWASLIAQSVNHLLAMQETQVQFLGWEDALEKEMVTTLQCFVNEGMQSARSEIFAGGDIVRGGATVILAMGDGRRAAQHMDEYLQKK